MNKFLINNINVSYRENHFSSMYNNYMTQPIVIHLELSSINLNDDDIKKLYDLSNSGGYVNVSRYESLDILKPFKDEFKEFLMEKYPEKILKNPEGFDRLLSFGSNK